MGSFIKHTNCPKCNSRNNLAVYREDDERLSGYCFGCEHTIYNMDGDNVEETTEDFNVETKGFTSDGDPSGYPYGTHEKRNVSQGTSELFGVRYSTTPEGTRGDIFYPYTRGESGEGAWKVRKLPKDFRVIGGLNGVELFGQSCFPAGGRTLIICEGEEDVLAVAEATYKHYNRYYPVVGLPSASNLKPVAENLEWIQSFKEVILWMDNDDAGEKAKQNLAKIIGYAKCKVVSSLSKDASDLLQSGNPKGILEAYWNAKPYNPQGILMKDELWKQVVEYAQIESVPYPECFRGLNEKTKGMRFGEISLFTSGTGAGKSTMLREVVDHLLLTTEDNVGIISLEESPAETAKKMAALRLNKNASAHHIPLEELSEGFEDVFGDDRVLMLDHQGAITESITSQLNYMAAMGCKYLFIDHITILVSEGADGLSGNEATDKVMNDLLKIAKTHNVWIGLVSHLRKSDKVGKSFEQGNLPSLDDIRGSGSIKQISMDIIAFARNSEEGDNTIQMRVLKCRHTGLTGNAGEVGYDNDSGRLSYTGATESDF